MPGYKVTSSAIEAVYLDRKGINIDRAASDDAYGHNTVTIEFGRIKWSPLWFSSFMLAKTLRSPGTDAPLTGRGAARAPGIAEGKSVVARLSCNVAAAATIALVGEPLCTPS